MPASGARGLSGVAGCVKDTEPEPKWAHHTDRASDRDEDDREQHFQDWLARYGKPYSDAVEANGGQPWSSSDDKVVRCSCTVTPSLRHQLAYL